ncbi:MAG TPA: orotidine-5'-phosphate decarboxylase [Caulifigura sp.]|nr:orotidine-5'-phosphate decarboxylase [Caulifigura sp.]
MNDYITRLHSAMQVRKTAALVGLDPREESLPAEFGSLLKEHPGDRFQRRAHVYEVFSRRVIDVVAPYVAVVKPQVAFFEDCGPAGMAAVQRVMRHARDAGLMVIADAKRGDIGSTAEAYASAWLAGSDPDAAPYPADALTVSPYLGADTLTPFVDAAIERGAGIYVLVRTSNPGSGSFQSLNAAGKSVCHYVAAEVERLSQSTRGAGSYGSVGAVVGATHPQELQQLRQEMPSTPFLVPGYGAQGGTAADVLPAFDAEGLGAVVNSSRNVIFAYRRPEYSQIATESGWEAAVAAAARDFANEFPVTAVEG